MVEKYVKLKCNCYVSWARQISRWASGGALAGWCEPYLHKGWLRIFRVGTYRKFGNL